MINVRYIIELTTRDNTDYIIHFSVDHILFSQVTNSSFDSATDFPVRMAIKKALENVETS